MSEEEEPNKLSSVKYYVLNDENASKFFDEWKLKTMALIKKKGWSAPFDSPTTEIPSAEQANAENSTEEQRSMFKANNEAYDQILMGCSGIPLGLVRRAKGDSRKAMEALSKKYSETDEANLTELLQEFVNCKLEDTETDPDKWFMKIDVLNDKLGGIDARYRKADYELKAHLMGNLPEGYNDVVTKISGTENDITVEEIEDQIRRKWKREFKTSEADKSGSKQVALVAKTGGKYKKPFKGKCRKCGIVGHKASDCRSNKKGICFECGEDGHFARDCPKRNKGTGNEAKEGMMGMFVGMAFCGNALPTPSTTGEEKTYLMDSGATSHIVSSDEEMTDLEDCNEDIVVGDNRTIKANKKGTLHLQTVDGKLLALQETLVAPEMGTCVVSVGKLTEKGNEVTMKSGSMKIARGSDSIEIKQDKSSKMYFLHAKRVKKPVEKANLATNVKKWRLILMTRMNCMDT